MNNCATAASTRIKRELDIFLHIGCAKAGSSYLQAAAACSRDDLADNGVWFPLGNRHDEQRMRAGKISSGNARALAEALGRGDRCGVARLVNEVLDQAKSHGCSRMLMSSEWLLSALSCPGRVTMLDEVLAESGIAKSNLLLILRDPVSQLISHYKHRAKRGTTGSIRDWSRSDYTLPGRLSGIRRELPNTSLRMTVRGYSKRPGAIAKTLFEDWLGVPTPSRPADTQVNPSLTLSELALIRHVAARRPHLVTDLYERLLAVDPAAKTESPEMLAHARGVAARAVAASASEWRHWNERLPQDERLDIPLDAPETGPDPDKAAFSTWQSAALMELVADLGRPRFLLGLTWRRRLRPALTRIRHGHLP